MAYSTIAPVRRAESHEWLVTAALATAGFFGSLVLTMGVIGHANDGASLVSAYVTPSTATRPGMQLDATHVQRKHAKAFNYDRPKKRRPSDRNRKPPVYPAIEEPETEYTVLSRGADRAGSN